ncbi:hypothetical protein HID58_014369 [Brassica napus]|uniref:Uncharacterized protein n=1 Tax=Brassica napus TaxID=3708 RepID=A0ABQ8DHY0_BRANA|nr:hypothetical protein HID58_014369 [Brassica napus]
MIFDALNVSRLLHCRVSTAEFPPPITTRGLFLKFGVALSHTAHAEIPPFQKPSVPSPDPAKLSRFTTAPVEMMTASARRRAQFSNR